METSEQPDPARRPIRHKWGEALNGGFVVIPSALLRKQKELRLSDGEVIVLLNLLASWWKTDDLPFPRTSTLAKRMGVTPRSIQRHMERLEAKKLIQRIWDRTGGRHHGIVVRYDLGGIVSELKRLGAIPHPSRQLPASGTLADDRRQTLEGLL